MLPYDFMIGSLHAWDTKNGSQYQGYLTETLPHLSGAVCLSFTRLGYKILATKARNFFSMLARGGEGSFHLMGVISFPHSLAHQSSARWENICFQ